MSEACSAATPTGPATPETAVRFLRQLPGFRGDSQLRTWSLGIAINVVRELRRAGHRDGPLPEEMVIVTDGRRASPAGPEEVVETNERRDIRRATLADLPDRQREAVVLRYFEELSAAEMLAPDEPRRPLVLRMFDAAGVLATAAALTFAVMRFGAMSGSEPDHWRRQLTSLGDRGKALVMAVSSGLPSNWERVCPIFRANAQMSAFDPRCRSQNAGSASDFRVMPGKSGTSWELPSVRLPQMSRPSEFPQHLRLMSPLNRMKKPDIELPETPLPEAGEAADNAA